MSDQHTANRGNLLVIRPDPLDELDRFGTWFVEQGLALRVVRPYAGEPVPDQLEEDGLVVLGGHMSAWAIDEYPWLEDICQLLRTAVTRSRPVLGICLGGQLLALAHGGRVVPGDAGEEAGVVTVDWRPESHADPVFSNLPSPFVAGAMHHDMIAQLPSGSVWLGQNRTYPHQAFRVGSCAWGVQFHPEASASLYEAWAEAAAAGADADVAMLERTVKQFRELDDEVTASTRNLALRFAAVVIDAANRLRPGEVS